MKSRIKQIIQFLFFGFLLAGCQQETELLTDSHTGYLMLSSVKAESEHRLQTGTRTVDPDFQLEICQNGETLHTFQPGQLSTTQKLQLPVGQYQLKVYTLNHQSIWGNNEKGEAQYYLEQNFNIAANQVNVVSVQVPMKNCAVTLRLPEEFDSWFTKYTFTITQNENEQERNVNLTNGETAYFSSGLTFSYSLAAHNQDNELNVTSGKIDTPAANIEYELTYSLQTASLKLKNIHP